MTRSRAAWSAVSLFVAAGLLGLLVALPWGPLVGLDRRIERSIHTTVLGRDWLADLARAVSHVGDPLVVTLASVGVVVVLAALRQWRAALYVAIVRLCAAATSTGIKHLVDRPRPAFAAPIAHASGFAFPSGHALGSAALWLSVALVSAGVVRRCLVPAALLVPLVVGATRVLLGVHFVTDVVAGLALGYALALSGWWLTSRPSAAVPRTGLVVP